MNTEAIDKLTRQLGGLLPAGLDKTRQDIEKNMHTLLQDTFSKLNLVTREEFDIQCALLQRSREKLDKLEKQLDQLLAGQDTLDD